MGPIVDDCRKGPCHSRSLVMATNLMRRGSRLRWGWALSRLHDRCRFGRPFTTREGEKPDCFVNFLRQDMDLVENENQSFRQLAPHA